MTHISGMIRIKETHETQSTKQFKTDVNDEKLYTPIEDLQRIEAGGVYNRNSFDTSKFPKRIRYLGYFYFVFCPYAYCRDNNRLNLKLGTGPI